MNNKESRKELLDLVTGDFDISRGHPLPLGATITRNGINFSVISGSASAVSLILFTKCANDPLVEFPLDPRVNKTGDIWHAHISGLDPGILYAYNVTGDDAVRRNGIQVLDPYSQAHCGGEKWAQPKTQIKNGLPAVLRLSSIIENSFDWERDQPLNLPLSETIIYEMHVRGFTRHSSSGVKNPGTFAGLIEKIPYLKELGITAVELMPVTDFDETGNHRTNPLTGETLRNYWGYDPISFFALKTAYASDGNPQQAVNEFKAMVRAMHKAGIEVILDMVFNHTAEGSEHGEIFNLKGLDRDVYYLFDKKTRHFLNYSGCGNTVNCNHPVLRTMILDCLRYWVTEMHVDGFRFDLASILSRGPDGEVLSDPPILERIALDPVLAKTKIIAEAWDAAGLYQVGDFPHWQRWMEWNGRFRDDVRRYIRGDEGTIPLLARRLSGSSDLYEDEGREPYHSVNFITAHDGFTLNDLVSYNKKHNQANGENNRDGENNNLSWNHGFEGPTENKEINKLRRRQMRNYAAILMLSQGVPMICAGDEFGRTQKGNNNAYCQDNIISWVDWALAEKNKDFLRFFRLLIAFRKEHKNLRRTSFHVATKNGLLEMSWHGTQINRPLWDEKAHTLGLFLLGDPKGESYPDIYIIFNGSKEEQVFELPLLPSGKKWKRVMDTYLESPDDFADAGKEKALKDQDDYLLKDRSVALFISSS